MDKINFQNDVTKVNANTFNTFQNNIEKAVVPIGGKIGQLLAKKSDTDNDVEWVEQSKITVEDTLTSTSATNALSANQGKVLNGFINDLETSINILNKMSAKDLIFDFRTIGTFDLSKAEDIINYQYSDLPADLPTRKAIAIPMVRWFKASATCSLYDGHYLNVFVTNNQTLGSSTLVNIDVLLIYPK